VWVWTRHGGKDADLATRAAAMDRARPLVGCTDAAFEHVVPDLWGYLGQAHSLAATPRYLWEDLA